MYQAIKTKFCGPTNFRGARIRVSAEVGSMFVEWDYSWNTADNHRRAAQIFADKWGWTGKWVGGFYDHCGYFTRLAGVADDTCSFEVR